MLANSSKLSFIGQVLIAVAIGAVIASGPAQAGAASSWQYMKKAYPVAGVVERGAVWIWEHPQEILDEAQRFTRYTRFTLNRGPKYINRLKHCRDLPTTTPPPWSLPRTAQCARLVTSGRSGAPYYLSVP